MGKKEKQMSENINQRRPKADVKKQEVYPWGA